MPLVVVVSAPDGMRSPSAHAVATEIVDRLRKSPQVSSVTSAWTAPPAAAPDLISRDGTSGLILASIRGGENQAPKNAAALTREFPGDVEGVSVRAGGLAIAFDEMPKQVLRDALTMELVAVPLSFVVLVWVFGGLAAAGGTDRRGRGRDRGITVGAAPDHLRRRCERLRAEPRHRDQSGSWAIDYTLLLISRYRDEIAEGNDPETALVPRR